MKRRNKLALALAAVALAALVAWALQPRPVTVETAVVARGAFELTVSDDGKTRVRERYVVSAPLAGRVERIALEEGDRVKQGQAIALLTPTAPALLDARTARELEARIGAAQARLAGARAETLRAQAQRDQARADYERQAKLAREGFVAESAREQATLALRTAERNVEAARFAQDAALHDLEQARAALKRYQSGDAEGRWEVTAPVSGSVLKVVQKSEGAVALGAPLVELGDARALEAVVDVLSQEAVAIRPGMPARIELGQGVPPLAAAVRLVEPAAFTKVSALGIEEQRVNVVLDFSDPLDKVQTIGDGFRVEAHIVTQRLDDAVKVPVGALWRDGDGWAVFVAEGERARKRKVEVTLRNTLEAVIAKGVAAGERVVVYPSDALTDGARLDVREQKGR
jgi:HlyD family secretion protein